ncbi:MAG: VCBS repeat-containing protein [Lachnospiraceae bacterium]|nr:VCBS repeat-containing protein [Lachnospiraceae bacterium]
MEEESHRAAVFLADQDGRIVYKTNRLECNYEMLGEMDQPIYDMVSVSFQDLNGDNLTDIILIAGCIQSVEDGQKNKYKIGEVLFQTEESNFYRDWWVNDKINRYGMNQSAKSIRSFIRDGQSTEFLYKATTEEELMENGFRVIEEQSHSRFFEKLGNLKLLPGFFSLGDYDIFMIYLINEQGAIVWSFEPMGEYDNLYALKGISTADLDGDGMKDILVLARYSKEQDDGSISIDTRYAIYYQRTDGFEQDTEFDLNLSDRSKEEQTVSNLVNEIRVYWGWQIGPVNG